MADTDNCRFCKLANKTLESNVIYENDELIAFLDTIPIRESHCLIVPKKHYRYFDELPQALSHQIVDLGQRIARAQKAIYGVERAGFLYNGADIAHVHAHVLPLFTQQDITSLRYLKDQNVVFHTPDKLSCEALEPAAIKLRASLQAMA